MKGLLVILACGSKKIWDAEPQTGPTAARYAYKSPLFAVGRQYAETFAQRWVVLSAKHGFIPPDFIIPGNYNVTFSEREAIGIAGLTAQVSEQELGNLPHVAMLGPYSYWDKVLAIFRDSPTQLHHVTQGVGFPPSYIKLVKGLIADETPFRVQK